ncbi:hypothetical protein E4U11_006449 [Claviceps purpurea]|nr:hypothetical protein E4U11_006449 [Claviceps purpurea]
MEGIIRSNVDFSPGHRLRRLGQCCGLSKTRLDREEWPAAYADFTALLWGFDVQLNCRTRICGQARVRAWARPIYHNPILCRIGLSPARH